MSRWGLFPLGCTGVSLAVSLPLAWPPCLCVASSSLTHSLSLSVCLFIRLSCHPPSISSSQSPKHPPALWYLVQAVTLYLSLHPVRCRRPEIHPQPHGPRCLPSVRVCVWLVTGGWTALQPHPWEKSSSRLPRPIVWTLVSLFRSHSSSYHNPLLLLLLFLLFTLTPSVMICVHVCVCVIELSASMMASLPSLFLYLLHHTLCGLGARVFACLSSCLLHLSISVFVQSFPSTSLSAICPQCCCLNVPNTKMNYLIIMGDCWCVYAEKTLHMFLDILITRPLYNREDS